MSQVLARFQLNKVTSQPSSMKDPLNNNDYVAVTAAFVELSAVKGEPFGSYTPNGLLTMFIVNPPAADVFFKQVIGKECSVLITFEDE